MKVKSDPRARSSALTKQLRGLRQRLSGDPERPITQERLARLLDVSWSTIARWESGGGRPDRHLSEKIERVSEVLGILGDMILREDRLVFFEQEHPLLMGLRPIDLLDNERGARKVVELLEGAESGSFA